MMNKRDAHFLMDNETLINNNLKFYDTIKPKNPENSYTVLATINEFPSGKLLALASGTQACNRVYDDDIEDCHAESLVKRAFKRHIIDDLINRKYYDYQTKKNPDFQKDLDVKQGGQQTIALSDKDNPCNYELTLFVSQFPCGLIKRYQGEEPRDESTGLYIKRKPGRGRNVPGKGTIYVEKDNCLNKIKRWLSQGLQGRRLNQQQNLFCSLRKILIGYCEPDEQLNYDKQLHLLREHLYLGGTIPSLISDRGNQFKKLPLSIELVKVRRNDFIFSPERQPQPISLVWWLNEPQQDGTWPLGTKEFRDKKSTHELIVDGRRRGLTTRQCIENRVSNKLKICTSLLRNDIDNLKGTL